MGRCDADQPSSPSSPYSDASLLSVPQPGAAAAPPGRRSTLPGLCADHLACSSKRAVQLAPAAAVPFRGRRAELTPTGHRTRRAELFWVRGFSGCSWLCAGLGGTGREKKKAFSPLFCERGYRCFFSLVPLVFLSCFNSFSKCSLSVCVRAVCSYGQGCWPTLVFSQRRGN